MSSPHGAAFISTIIQNVKVLHLVLTLIPNIACQIIAPKYSSCQSGGIETPGKSFSPFLFE